MEKHLDIISKLKDREDILEYCGWCLPHLGKGSGRKTFDLGKGLVFKLSINEAGKKQNEVEVSLHKNKHCANIIQHASDYTWIIAEKLIPLCKKTMYKMVGVDEE